MGEATFFTDGSAKTIREGEVPDASFGNGANNAGSNACGIGMYYVLPALSNIILNFMEMTMKVLEIKRHFKNPDFLITGKIKKTQTQNIETKKELCA